MCADPLEPRPHVVSCDGGRIIAWHEYGCLEDPKMTVVYCHGTPGSGYEALFFDESARELGIRVIAIDRPGLGASDAVEYRTIASWADDDVATVLEHLELDKVSVIGFSGGGPHAMAIAARLPGLVDRLALLAPFTHHSLWSMRIGLLLTPLRVHVSHLTMSWFPKRLIDAVAQAAGALAGDRSAFVRALSGDVQGRTAAYRMAVAHDYALQFVVRGGLKDEYAIQGDWGFSEASVRVPVDVWIAGKDLAVKPARARNLGLRLGATLHELPEDGHFSLLMNHSRDILGSLLARSEGVSGRR